MRVRVLLLLVVLALLAVACGRDDRNVLATVDGVDITVDEFERALLANRASQGGFGDVNLGSPESANILTNLIAVQAIRAPMAELGVEFPELLGGGDAVEQQIIGDALNATADAILGISGTADEDRVVAEHLAGMDPLDRPSCSAHILSPTEAESIAIVERLDAGESFEDLAIELSTDPGSGQAGGSLGCRAPSEYVPEFADALTGLAVDEVSGPVESAFGSHIIKRLADNDEVAISALFAARNDTINEWITSTFENADVDLDPAVGVWTGTGIRPADTIDDGDDPTDAEG